eukprot:258497_1
MMLMVNGFIWWSARKKRGPKCARYGPLVMTMVAAVLIMADLSRHVGQDLGWWAMPQYQPHCGSESVRCLSAIGVFFTIVCTYSGYILLAVGTMWNANICKKLRIIRRRFREIRNQRRGAAELDEAQYQVLPGNEL